jgi:DNA-binding LytR/AlgR family response regulator
MKSENQNTAAIRALIVDDEERARDLLEKLLIRIPGILVCGKAASADDALEMVIAEQPDLVFLDVQMPGKTGFDLVDYLQKYMPCTRVIFVTAHAEFAIPAFKVSAFDYLLKPVMMDQLNDTILRFKAEKLKHQQEKNNISEAETEKKPSRLKFNTRNGYILISPDEIIYCEADVNYTMFYFGNNNREVVTVNLGRTEQILTPWSFYRISRSVLINPMYLRKADRQKKKCLLEKGTEKIWLDIPPNHIRKLEKLIDNTL